MVDEVDNANALGTADPVAQSRRATRRALVGGLALVVATAAWALWPIGSTPGLNANERNAGPSSSASDDANLITIPTLDLAAFNAPLWVHPPAPVVAKVEPPPPPLAPFKAQLLAITTGHASEDGVDSGHRAIFYDEAKDALVTVGVGDEVVGRRVTVVDADGVTLEQGSRTQRFDLRPKRDRRPLAASAAEDLAALMGRPWPISYPTTPPTNPTGTGVDP